MAVIAEVTLRGVSEEQYDAVRQRTGWLERQPAGGLAHLTWWDGPDCRNVDGWESEAAFSAFGEQRLGPAMTELGLDVQPEVTFHPAHEIYTPQRGVVAATPTPAAAATDNVSVVRSGYAAFAAGDIPGVLALFAPEMDWYTPDSVRFGGRFSGPAGVGEFFSGLSQNFAELRVDPERLLDAVDTVVVQGVNRGRTTAGAPFEVPWVHVWTLRGGVITSFTEYFDSARMNAALNQDRTTVWGRTQVGSSA
jgi:ketosteroid isomerase-like protein